MPASKKPANGSSASAPTEPTPEEPAPSARARARQTSYEPAYTDSERRPAAERENAFNTLAWMIEGAAGLLEELRHNDFGLSEDFWVHAYAARREALLAVRSALDTVIEKTTAAEVAEQERQKQRERRGGIDIEF